MCGEGGGGGEQRIFKRITDLFFNLVFKTQKINAITQVSQGILSTIVGTSLALQYYAGHVGIGAGTDLV